MKDISLALLILAMAIYFCISAVGRAKLDKEQIEATRLNIEVLKLQLKELSNAIDEGSRKQ